MALPLAIVLTAVTAYAGTEPVAAQDGIVDCPSTRDGIPLLADGLETSDGQQVLTCSYRPVEGQQGSELSLVVTWVPKASSGDVGEVCGGSDIERTEGVRWYGFGYSDSLAARVWYNAADQTLDVDQSSVRSAAIVLLFDAEANAAMCSATSEPTAGVTPDQLPTTPATEPTPVAEPSPLPATTTQPPPTTSGGPPEPPTEIAGIVLAIPPPGGSSQRAMKSGIIRRCSNTTDVLYWWSALGPVTPVWRWACCETRWSGNL